MESNSEKFYEFQGLGISSFKNMVSNAFTVINTSDLQTEKHISVINNKFGLFWIMVVSYLIVIKTSSFILYFIFKQIIIINCFKTRVEINVTHTNTRVNY